MNYSLNIPTKPQLLEFKRRIQGVKNDTDLYSIGKELYDSIINNTTYKKPIIVGFNISSDCRSPDKSRTWSWVRLQTGFAPGNRCNDSFCIAYTRSYRWTPQSLENTCFPIGSSCFLACRSIFQETIHGSFYRRCLVVKCPDSLFFG